ncbi:MAG: hypothetical protein ACRDE2_17180, partial [Chitinophagaceae bacterium]
MKNKIFLFLATIAFVVLALKCSAQQMPDMTSDGFAKITIEKKGAKPEIYSFPGAFPSGLKCVKYIGETPALGHTEILFIYYFDNSDGTQTLVTVSMRISPNKAGTFQLPINGDLAVEGHLSVNIDSGNSSTILLDASPQKGTGGTITIQH